MKKPAMSGLPGTKTRFDDFQVAHAFKTEIAHFVVRASSSQSFVAKSDQNTRANSCPSIVTSSGPTRKPCARSADTPAPSRELPLSPPLAN